MQIIEKVLTTPRGRKTPSDTHLAIAVYLSIVKSWTAPKPLQLNATFIVTPLSGYHSVTGRFQVNSRTSPHRIVMNLQHFA